MKRAAEEAGDAVKETADCVSTEVKTLQRKLSRTVRVTKEKVVGVPDAQGKEKST